MRENKWRSRRVMRTEEQAKIEMRNVQRYKIIWMGFNANW